MLHHLLIFFILKEFHHETVQNVQKVQQTVVFQNCLPDSQAQSSRIFDCNAGRNSPLSDALLFPDQGLSGSEPERERSEASELP